MGDFPNKFTSEELKSRLTAQQFAVTQKSGTERAFTGEYWNNHKKGIYKCVVCNEDLFTSETKFDSGSGWPSFYDVLTKGKVKLISDKSHFMVRTEVLCGMCGAHLGHVFDDGPKPTGQRYCINSASLNFAEGQNCSL
uniref:Peptide-methionine (R)-S-oxide reductase n=1 Tax=Clytia hemisphaerica TaxID=252671 RepID=A0A7M5WX26_9CNID